MELFDLTGSLQRAVAPPGEFKTYFPSTTDDDLAGTLADGLAEAQLDGFLRNVTLDAAAFQTDVDLNSGQQALVVLYARARIIVARLANIKSRTRYKAGNVEAEVEQAASVLVELLKEMSLRKKQILEDARAGNVADAFLMVDMYVAKSIDASTPDLAYLRPGGF